MASVMREIQEHTCLKFVPKTTETNYIRIVNGSGCSSPVGQDGGMQRLSLTDSDCCGSCWTRRTVIHEMFHAIGLWHEQSRYDRDQYIKINEQNINPSLKYNFDITYQNESYLYDVEYNYWSVMHYQKNVFSKDGKSITIETKDPMMMDIIGNQKQAHELDYEKIRRIYDCSSGSYPTMPPPPDSVCEDKLTYCDQVKDQCGTADYTKTHCKKTCKFCDPEKDKCKDTITYCYWQRNNCNQEWAKTSCRKTCRYC